MEILTKKSISIGKKQYIYYRPSQARKIPLKTMSNRGFLPSLKKNLKGIVLEYESQLERDFLFLLDQDPNCIDLQTQPVEIIYINKSGKEKKIYPDCWAIFVDERQILFDIKPENQYRKLIKTNNWMLRLKAIHEFCKKVGWTYQVITEKKILCTRLNTIKDLLNAAKHFAPAKFNKEIGKFDSNLKRILEASPLKFNELVNALHPLLPLEPEEVISLLKHKIYFNILSIDWDKPLEETSIFLNEELPPPVYALEDNFYERDRSNLVVQIPEKEKLSVISESEQENLNWRLNLITPIINQYGKEAKKSEILQYCEENDKPLHSTYKWYRIWKKKGKDGLIPKRSRKHTKSHLEQGVENVLQEVIWEWNQGEWIQIKAAYTIFCQRCYELGLKPATYKTFRIRINALPAVEKRGKFRPKTQSFIKRGLSGTYREGRYPGAVIQMDHTKLDIWLIDSFTKQPLGRPWITLGIDVFSRSIWGFYISFDSPSQESVTQAILNGLISKEQLNDWRIFESQLIEKGLNAEEYRWPCGGIPALIQVDNSREFRANLVRRLCMDSNITLEFRPVKTPEFGGFIESIWDTINDGIRNAKLKGRVFSLPKSRESVKRPKFRIPPDYYAKKEADYTLKEFKEWLFYYLVVSYSSDIRARQNHAPNEIWLDGLRGDNFQPMGGALRLLEPSEYLKLDFQSKIPIEATLSENGLRYKNIYYTSEWLKQARKERILKDGEKYEFRVSHLDIRRAWIIDPETNHIETLEAYKYDGDKRIWDFIEQGLGKKPGYKDFPISLKMIQYARKILGKSKKNMGEIASIMKSVTEQLAEKGKLNKKDQRIFEKLSKSQEGRDKLAAAGIIAQFENGTLPMLTTSANTSIKEEPIPIQDDSELKELIDESNIPMTSDTKEALRRMIFWESDEEEI